MKTVKVAEIFSKYPGPRYIAEGEYSGEAFRDQVLLPIVKRSIESGEKILIDLDGTNGYGTSFLEETFGGLIRVNKLKYSDLKNIFGYKSEEEPYLIDDIQDYMEAARDENQ
jgi:hypothetical protein